MPSAPTNRPVIGSGCGLGAPGPSRLETWDSANTTPEAVLTSKVAPAQLAFGHPELVPARRDESKDPHFSFSKSAPRRTHRSPSTPYWLLPIACLLISACKPVGPNYSKPAYNAPTTYKETGASTVVPPPNPPNGTWTPANPSDGMLTGKWWQIYQDPALNKLEDRIATTNVQLKQALETYLAARDQVAVARANFFPQVSASASPQGEKYSANEPLFNKANVNSTVYSDYVIQGQATWEPDFWGRIRRTVEQARAGAQASAADAAAVELTLEAEMATDYYALRGLDSQIKLLTDTVTDLQNQLDLTQRRLTGGVATDVDVAQAQTELETVRAQLVDVGVARAQFEHAIGTLANYNLSDFSIPPSPLDLALPRIPTGVPSQLLERRPDIAAVERQTAAANAQIGIAVSAYYPTITLGTSGGFQSTSLGTLIQGPSSMWTLGGQAAELLFDAGQRHALTDQARHSYEAQADGYRNTVFSAFEDVEDQLAALRILEQESVVEQRAVDAAQRSFDLSNKRYKGGVTSYLEVLTAEQTLLQDQVTAINIGSRQFASSVSLIRALGGGWDVTQLPK